MSKKKFNQIVKHLIEFFKKFKLVGSFKEKGKKVYNNDFNLPESLNKINKNSKNLFAISQFLHFQLQKILTAI